MDIPSKSDLVLLCNAEEDIYVGMVSTCNCVSSKILSMKQMNGVGGGMEFISSSRSIFYHSMPLRIELRAIAYTSVGGFLVTEL